MRDQGGLIAQMVMKDLDAPLAKPSRISGFASKLCGHHSQIRY